MGHVKRGLFSTSALKTTPGTRFVECGLCNTQVLLQLTTLIQLKFTAIMRMLSTLSQLHKSYNQQETIEHIYSFQKCFMLH